jgi:hypothetical protein
VGGDVSARAVRSTSQWAAERVLTVKGLAGLDRAGRIELDVGRRGRVRERAAGCALVRRSSDGGLSEHASDESDGSERYLDHCGESSSTSICDSKFVC